MKSDKPTFHLVGMAPDTVAILFDIIAEMCGIINFNIWHNISVGEEVNLPLTDDRYRYHVHRPDEAADLKEYDTSNIFFGLTGPEAKQAVFEDFIRHADVAETMYETLAHPTAYVSPSAQLANGVLLEPGAIVSAQTHINFGVSIKRGVSLGHHGRIGRYCEINPGVVISGNVTMGKKTVIGSGASIIDNVEIGKNTTIGMGSNVLSDIPPNVVAYGNPCKVKKRKCSLRRDKYIQSSSVTKFE